MRHVVFIGLGSNLDEPHDQLERAFDALDELPETKLIARSSLYRSAPVGFDDQPDFVNAVAKIETSLSPQALLLAVLQVEHRHGRERTFRNAPRTLDLDILLYDDVELDEPGLSIPHPRIDERAFVLLPLVEVAPEIIIPSVGYAKDALMHCRDQTLERIKDAA